jgi:hypothetical protein
MPYRSVLKYHPALLGLILLTACSSKRESMTREGGSVKFFAKCLNHAAKNGRTTGHARKP